MARNSPLLPALLSHSLTPLLLLSPLLLSAQSPTPPNKDEKQILLKMKSDWGNPPTLRSWIDAASASHHCGWAGIRCSGGAVTGISLQNQNLTNPIPPAVCGLRNLSYLDLSNNYHPGSFPRALYDCSNLEHLDVSRNLFVGEIPADIDRLPAGLKYLGLAGNNFTCHIPHAIGRLPAIRTLLLHDNLFNGSFSTEIGNLSDLETLTLAYNPFSPASIPQEFGNLTRLRYLWMTGANLRGEIPESFKNLKQLEHLDLAQNLLSGRIPGEIWMLEKLKILYLFSNNLAGEINPTVRALNLVEINVSKNRLSGPIPEDFGKLKNLTILFLYSNRLSDEIPVSIGLLPKLTDIRLFCNRLTGVLPAVLGKHSELWNLEVFDNRISGELPQYLCSGRAFTSLSASNNKLTGELPVSLADCTTLDNLQLHNNNFSGDFPTGIWSVVNLTTVLIHHNNFSGELPDELPWNLAQLEIDNNRFSGRIPSSAGSLRVFKAGNNEFGYEIPANLGGISQLQRLLLGGNRLSGEIPHEISIMRSLAVLDLSRNQLSGQIPAGMGSLPVLTSLDLSSNQLSGEIPPVVGNMKLSFLNLSSNQLSGEIPFTLQNQAYEESFLSNPGLCSSRRIANLETCAAQLGVPDEFSRWPLVFLLLCAVLAGATVFFFGVLNYLRKKIDSSWEFKSFELLDFTPADIITGLTEENLIGSGGSGKVYKVRVGLPDGELVAVKKIWNKRMSDPKLEKQFRAEVTILGSSIRHANIVKLLSCIWNSKSNSKLLVYEYMENGSLDQWLHGCRSERLQPLDWPTRIGIAIGATQGLCYMHHGCSPPIVHGDVKSSNILLDSEFGAKIADFGLARMLVKAGEPETVSVVAGSFGYMAPECQCKKVNEKMDVYSFGVVLLELATGKRADYGAEHESLADWARRYIREGGSIMDAIDAQIRDRSHVHWAEVEVVFRLGLCCTEPSPPDRPSMKVVLEALLRFEPALWAGNYVLRWEPTAAYLHPPKQSSRQKSLSVGV